MGFLVTTLIFAVIGIIACLCTRICCNRGPSANLDHDVPFYLLGTKVGIVKFAEDQKRFHLTLVLTATICCWMMWAIVYMAQMKPLIVPILSEGE